MGGFAIIGLVEEIRNLASFGRVGGGEFLAGSANTGIGSAQDWHRGAGLYGCLADVDRKELRQRVAGKRTAF